MFGLSLISGGAPLGRQTIVQIGHRIGFESTNVLLRTGDLVEPNGSGNPFLNCLFCPFDSANQQIDFSSPTLKVLPLGQAIDLHLGVVVSPDGNISRHPRIESLSTKVAISQSNARSLARSEVEARGLLPSLRFPLRAGFESEDSRWFVIDSVGTQAPTLVVPATEVFSAYIARNSRLAAAVVDASLLDVLASLRADNRNRLLDDGQGFIFLDRHRLISDALPLARALFDASGCAAQSMEHAVNSILVARRQRGAISIDCTWPFRGESDLEYLAWVVPEKSGNPEVHIVLALVSCSASFPWESLVVYIDQPSSVGGSGRRPKSKPGARFQDFESDFVPLDPHAERPIRGGEVVAKTARRFSYKHPDANIAEVVRRAIDRNDGSVATATTAPEGFTAQTRGKGREANTQSAIIDRGGDDSKDDTGLTPDEAFQSVTNAIEAVCDSGLAAVNELLISPSLLTYRGWVLNEVSRSLISSGRARNWDFIRGGTVARSVLSVSLTGKNREIYVFEILRNPSDKFSTLMVRAKSGDCLHIDSLAKIFGLIDKHFGVPSDRELESVGNLHWLRVRHPTKMGSRHTLSLRIEEFLS